MWADGAPIAAPWRRLPGAVDQVFTHFALSLAVYAARYEGNAPDRHFWVMRESVGDAGFSNVMRKAVAHAVEAGLSMKNDASS